MDMRIMTRLSNAAIRGPSLLKNAGLLTEYVDSLSVLFREYQTGKVSDRDAESRLDALNIKLLGGLDWSLLAAPPG